MILNVRRVCFVHLQRKDHFYIGATGSWLALSVKPCRACQLSQRESPWQCGKVSGQTTKPAGFARASPFEERLPPRRGKMSCSDKRGSVSPQVTERARPLPGRPLSFYHFPYPCSTWNNFSAGRRRWGCALCTRYSRPFPPGERWRAHRCRSSDGWHGRWCSQRPAHP